MKKQSEAEKKEREAKFRRENLIPENELKPPGKGKKLIDGISAPKFQNLMKYPMNFIRVFRR